MKYSFNLFLDKNASRVIAVGGRNSSNQPLVSVEMYNPEKQAWEFGPLLPEPVSRGSAVEYKGDLLIVGGLNALRETGTIYRFSLKSGWTTMNFKPLPINTFGAVVLLVPKELCASTKYVSSCVPFS